MLLEAGIAFSLHIGFNEDNFNEVHPWAEYCKQPKNSYALTYTPDKTCVGAFLNSHSRVSAYVKGVYIWDDKHSIEYAVMTGYPEMIVAPMVRYSYQFNDTVDLFIMPGAMMNETTLDVEFGIVVGISFSIF